MKKIKKNKFISWQKYEGEHTFMYQGFLLLLSGAVSTLLYFLLVLLLSQFKDSVLTTVIYNGDLITTKLSPPIFWSAIIAAAVVIALFVFSDVLKLILRKLIVRDISIDDRFAPMTPKQIKFRVRRAMALQYTFYISVYVLWLYAAAVFSFLIKNGAFLYPLIFVMLTFLTFFGKKLFCFPIYTLMKRQQLKEKQRRSDNYLLFKTAEGGSHGDIVTKQVTQDKFPVICSVVEKALKTVHSSPGNIKIVMGERIIVYQTSHNKFDVRIGISALAMLTEDELYATLCSAVMERKNPCLDLIKRFISLNQSVRFSRSSWNPLERVYKSFDVYVSVEVLETEHLFLAADQNRVSQFLEKYGEEVERCAIVAAVKQWIYRNHEFGFDRSFYTSLFENKRPLPDYHKRLMRRYWTYLSQNSDHICQRFSQLDEQILSIFPYDAKKLSALAKDNKLDLQKRPKGAYNDEVKRFSKEFDNAFALCVRSNYKSKRRALYLDPTARIRTFEGERINGAFKSDSEILSVANDYLTLEMPTAALSLVSELEDKENVYARYIEGKARLYLGEKKGVELLADVCREMPLLALNVSAKLLSRFPMILSNEELAKYYTAVKVSGFTSAGDRISGRDIWQSDELKGECRLTSRCSPSRLTNEEKEAISKTLQNLCHDRLEWAAVVNYTDMGRSTELVVVRLSDLSAGSYTDSYVDGVYLESLNLLACDVRLLSIAEQQSKLGVTVDIYSKAPIEPFEKLKGSVICHKGSIAAKRFLSREAKSYESVEETYDEIDADDPDEL